ncbi:hypothetical protein KA075_02060 [Candidatus Saccharibacteria bacterium]|jgi:hypothetical protein|nr:hypothetical protein [Candidatus Saccharibacteria bacterium]
MKTPDMSPPVEARNSGTGNPEYIKPSLEVPEELGLATARSSLPPINTIGYTDELCFYNLDIVAGWREDGTRFTVGKPHPTKGRSTEELERSGMRGYTTYELDGTVRARINLRINKI